MKAAGLHSVGPPSPTATSVATLSEFWREAGFVGLQTRAIAINVEFAGFDDFWGSLTVPVGPAGMAIAELSDDRRAELRDILRERTPPTADGRIVYPAHANAITGRRPG